MYVSINTLYTLDNVTCWLQLNEAGKNSFKRYSGKKADMTIWRLWDSGLIFATNLVVIQKSSNYPVPLVLSFVENRS